MFSSHIQKNASISFIVIIVKLKLVFDQCLQVISKAMELYEITKNKLRYNMKRKWIAKYGAS